MVTVSPVSSISIGKPLLLIYTLKEEDGCREPGFIKLAILIMILSPVVNALVIKPAKDRLVVPLTIDTVADVVVNAALFNEYVYETDAARLIYSGRVMEIVEPDFIVRITV